MSATSISLHNLTYFITSQTPHNTKTYIGSSAQLHRRRQRRRLKIAFYSCVGRHVLVCVLACMSYDIQHKLHIISMDQFCLYECDYGLVVWQQQTKGVCTSFNMVARLIYIHEVGTCRGVQRKDCGARRYHFFIREMEFVNFLYFLCLWKRSGWFGVSG